MTETLPFKALPELSELIDALNEGLQKILDTPSSLEDKSLAVMINSLHNDLTIYIQNIEIWHQLSTTEEQKQQLKDIEHKADKAQHLLTKAIGLMKPWN